MCSKQKVSRKVTLLQHFEEELTTDGDLKGCILLKLKTYSSEGRQVVLSLLFLVDLLLQPREKKGNKSKVKTRPCLRARLHPQGPITAQIN